MKFKSERLVIWQRATILGVEIIKHFVFIYLCILLLAGCKNKPEEQRSFSRMNRFEDQNIVVTGFARKGTFYREFESNGKLRAVNRAVLTYELDEKILSVEVRNGQRVAAEQVLSTLDDTNQRYNYDRACRMLEKCRLNLEDALISMGYQLKDSLSVPQHLMNIALIRSGYKDALSEKEQAMLQLGKTRIKAPFSGVVAKVEAKPHNRSGQYKEFCTLIDNTSFEVDFPVLENEAAKLSPGTPVAVIPYAFDNDTITGRLTALNPSVNEAGMMLASALTGNASGKLTDGMNVKVIVRDPVPGQVIIPKSAVTLRQEKNVVFVCKNDTAHWRYVKIGEENALFCTIRGDAIKPGEEVIIEGNFNLSHLAPVVKMGQ